MISAKQLRTDFPEFTSPATFPEPQVTFWLAMAGQLINVNRWGPSAAEPWPTTGTIPARTVYDLGCELFVAHNLVLQARNAKGARKAGGIPGTVRGPINMAAVDKAHVGYDAKAGLEAAAGHWNLTTYGLQFRQLMLTMGAGPLQIC